MVTIDRILELVSESGLTAKEFASEVGIAGGSITDWKTGRSKPSINSLKKIANYAHVQLEWLTGDSDFRTIKEDFNNFNIQQNKIDLLKTIDRYYYEYVVPCSLKEKDIDFLTETISNTGLNNVKESKARIDSFVNSFDSSKRKKIREFINILVKELMDDLKNRNTVLHYASLIEIDNKNKTINDSFVLSKVPIVGKIAAGQPILAEEYIEGYLPVEPNVYGLTSSEDLFYLKVAGQSMNLKVKNGDYALIHKQDYAEDGDIVVAIVNGDDEATLKRYKRLNEQFVLLEPMSTDPTIEAITVDLKNTKFQIIGKAIGQFGKF